MVLCARLCGYSGNQDARFSTIFEYLHAATLLHDDLVDGATAAGPAGGQPEVGQPHGGAYR
jgi:hypothetical protein